MSVRIPRRLKEEMMRLKDFVNWKREIVEFLERRVAHYRRLKVLMEVEEVLKGLPETRRGFAAWSVRSDRDSH